MKWKIRARLGTKISLKSGFEKPKIVKSDKFIRALLLYTISILRVKSLFILLRIAKPC